MDSPIDDFITVKTFSYPNEVAVIRARLESEGIECFVKDEQTAQVNPFYSNAIGGVKLQVKESDLTKAKEILKDAGYIQEEDKYPSKLYIQLDSFTSKVPFLKNQRLELRLLVIVPILVSLIVTAVYFAILPSAYERLTKHMWCVDYVTYKGIDYKPNSKMNLQLEIIGQGFCNERVDFRTNGKIILPGFNTSNIWGDWALNDNFLHLYNLDTLQHVFEGDYNFDFTKNKLLLQSPTTTIHCYHTNL